VHLAAGAFSRVALYFENSILAPDLKFLSAAAASVRRMDKAEDTWTVDSPGGVGVRWAGGATLDGKPWPLTDGATIWVPAGVHKLSPSAAGPETRVLDFNGDLQSAEALSNGELQLDYSASSRAIAILEKRPSALEVDGAETVPELLASGPNWALLLPRGRHSAKIRFQALRASVPQ
jgi:hypothetical protein